MGAYILANSIVPASVVWNSNGHATQADWAGTPPGFGLQAGSDYGLSARQPLCVQTIQTV